MSMRWILGKQRGDLGVNQMHKEEKEWLSKFPNLGNQEDGVTEESECPYQRLLLECLASMPSSVPIL